MNDRELCSLIEQEVSSAIGHWSGGTLAVAPSKRGDLATERAMELDYYNGQPFGNEVEGESQVVSTDVFDTVEGMLPALLRIFTASDDVVRFDPNGPEDDEAAKQQTEVCNYVFYRQNNGFLVLYEWFKDALIQKNGVVKYWWEKKTEATKEQYEGLTEIQFRKFESDPEVEILAHTAYPDPVFQQQRMALLNQPLTPAMAEQVQAQPVPHLHDVELRISKDRSKCCIEVVPPEEFGISAQHKCISIQDTPFCYHRTKKTVSWLRENGCPEEVIAEIGGGDDDARDLGVETQARDRFNDESAFTPTEHDKQVYVTDCFYRVDFDDDGVAELRHIVKAGNAVWINEETDHINFAAITPIIMPHRWVGRSVAELVMSDQFTKSTLLREMFNNLYLTNRPRKVVLSSASGIVQANLDDLMTSRVGGIMREYVPNAIRHEEIPFVAGASFPMLEYIDKAKEARTSITPYTQGTDADSLNKTARGIGLIQAAGQQRTDLIARVFAETGVKDLMRGIVYMLSKYSTKAMTMRLRNEWVEVDPRQWKTQFDMVVNVGLGTGNKDAQLAHLDRMGARQVELIQTGRGYMVSDENVYNLDKKRAEAMGFKHPELFLSDPSSVPPEAKQKPPPPEIVKIQAEKETDQAKIESNIALKKFDADHQEKMALIASETQKAVAAINAQSQERLAMLKAHQEGQDVEVKREEAMAQLALDREVADARHALEREQAERRVALAAWEAEQKAALERDVAMGRLEIERMKAANKPQATQ